MNFIIIFIIVLVIIFIISRLYPQKTGQLIYKISTAIESRLYGLKKQQINLNEDDNETDEKIIIHAYHTRQLQKPTILMLHGFSADKDVWMRFARFFKTDYNLLIPDMAGHGETGFNKNWNYSSPSQAGRLLKLIDTLKIDKVHIIGNSMGGEIAAHFAMRFPERTATVCLVDPAGVTSPVPSDMEKLLAENKNPFLLNTREEFDAFYPMTMAKPPYVPESVLATIAEKYISQRQQLKQIFSDFINENRLDNSLHKIKAPTLLVWGELDRLIHVSSVETWEAGIETIKVKIFSKTGHMPMLERPKDMAEVYREFLHLYHE